MWKAPNGKVAATEEEAADMLQAKFAEEFAHGAVLVAKDALCEELAISRVDSEGTALQGAPPAASGRVLWQMHCLWRKTARRVDLMRSQLKL